MRRSVLWHAEQFSFGDKSCKQWYDKDKAKLRPFEFYPNCMRCLEAYGCHAFVTSPQPGEGRVPQILRILP
jgi:hypothetical protein